MSKFQINPSPQDSSPHDNPIITVSRMYKPDLYDFSIPRKEIDDLLRKRLSELHESNEGGIISIIGEPGMGKTHFFWVLKKQSISFRFLIGIPYLTASRDYYHHLYIHFLKGGGFSLLKSRIDSLFEEIGGSCFSLDPLGLILIRRNQQELLEALEERLPKISSQTLKFLVKYKLGNSRERMAVYRWILGEKLRKSQMDLLGLTENKISANDIQMIFSLLFASSDRKLELYLDELDFTSLTTHELNKITIFLENMFRIQHDLILYISCSERSWSKLKNALSEDLRTKIRLEIELPRFSIADIKRIYSKFLSEFWGVKGHSISEQAVSRIFQKSRGVPRLVFKSIQYDIFNALGNLETIK